MFFLIMLIGYICRKIGVFKDTTGKTISSIVINIGNPALIIASGMNPERLENKGKSVCLKLIQAKQFQV